LTPDASSQPRHVEVVLLTGASVGLGDARLLWWFRRFMPQAGYVWLTYHTLPGVGKWGRRSDEETHSS
jgi:hypothetical protein